MPKISKYQSLKSDFLENGYIKIDNLIDSKDLSKMKKVIEDLITKEDWRGGWEGAEEHMKYKKKFNKGSNRLGNLINKSKVFYPLISIKILNDLAKDLLGEFHIGGFDMREPLKNSGMQGLHIDFLPNTKKNQCPKNIIALIYLDDAYKDNGCIRVVPKTQKLIGPVQNYLKSQKKHKDEIYVDANAGDIILFNSTLWHGGTRNSNGSRRRVIFIDYRKRSIPQLLNQKIYLDNKTLKVLDSKKKKLLNVRNSDKTFIQRRYTSGDFFRAKFKGKVVTKEYN